MTAPVSRCWSLARDRERSVRRRSHRDYHTDAGRPVPEMLDHSSCCCPSRRTVGDGRYSRSGTRAPAGQQALALPALATVSDELRLARRARRAANEDAKIDSFRGRVILRSNVRQAACVSQRSWSASWMSDAIGSIASSRTVAQHQLPMVMTLNTLTMPS